MKDRQIAMLCLLLVSSLSCHAPRHAYPSGARDESDGGTPGILFLDYQISRDSSAGTYDAKLLSMLKREGKIKESPPEEGPPANGDLELLVLDRNEGILIRRHIPNPLDKSVEYVNDAGQFERIMIHLDSAQFSIRLPLEPGASSLLLNGYILNETEARPLLKTPIL